MFELLVILWAVPVADRQNTNDNADDFVEALLRRVEVEKVKQLKGEWDKWLAFPEDDPKSPVPLEDIIFFFEQQLKELEGGE